MPRKNSLGTSGKMPTLTAINRAGADSTSTSSKNTNDEQRSLQSHGSGSKDPGRGQMEELADSMAAAMVAEAMRDAGWDESNDGLVRDAVPDSPDVSVTDELSSANSDRVRGDSTLNDGDLSMSSSELTNPAPPTTSPSSSMAPGWF